MAQNGMLALRDGWKIFFNALASHVRPVFVEINSRKRCESLSFDFEDAIGILIF